MTELRAGASVQGVGCDLGKIDALVIDPTAQVVTHLVVTHEALGRRVLVPLSAVTNATAERVDLDLTDESFHKCELFDEPSYNVPGADYEPPASFYEPGSYFLEPFASPADGWAMADHERIPKGEVTLRRGDEVYSSDGTRVGHADEFLIDPTDAHVTHVVLRKGHILRHSEDVVVPIAEARFEEGRVVLGLDLAAVHLLERIPVKRHGHVHQGDVTG